MVDVLLCRGLQELHVWAEAELMSSAVAASEAPDNHFMVGCMWYDMYGEGRG
jgi:hypothetical protein